MPCATSLPSARLWTNVPPPEAVRALGRNWPEPVRLIVSPVAASLEVSVPPGSAVVPRPIWMRSHLQSPAARWPEDSPARSTLNNRAIASVRAARVQALIAAYLLMGQSVGAHFPRAHWADQRTWSVGRTPARRWPTWRSNVDRQRRARRPVVEGVVASAGR